MDLNKKRTRSEI